jgi:phosphoglycerate-specific signal transduction histidine kinase
LAPLRRSLVEHPIYAQIDCVDALQLFMQHHVFAVWDFMSLLKALQQRLSYTQVPWLPPLNRQGCRLVNEIVLGEESDEDGNGGYASHFELYHQAMRRCGAVTTVVDQFLDELRAGLSVQQALINAGAPNAVRDFVLQTFGVIDSGNLCAIASTFTFGREDLLPDLFRQIVDKLSVDGTEDLSFFTYYLQRHIDLDGDHHGPLAEKLIDVLCGDSEANWQVAEDAAVRALESRLRLWDSVVSSAGAA